MVSDSLRTYAQGNKSVIGLFDVKQTTLSEFQQMPEYTCNSQMCNEQTKRHYCSEECRRYETTQHYYDRR